MISGLSLYNVLARMHALPRKANFRVVECPVTILVSLRVAAPRQRLWTVIDPRSRCPETLKASRKVAMNALEVSGHLSDVMKVNPSMGGHVLDTYSLQAATGQ